MMQLLVLANNYLLLFAGWEGVGLASYLLIGFHHERWTAGIAAMKAFIINRAADVGFLLGIVFIILKTGTANVLQVQVSSCALDRHGDNTRLCAAAGRRGRQVRSIPAPYLAA